MSRPASVHVGMSCHPCVALIFGPWGRRFELKRQSGRYVPAFHWPRLSLGLLVWDPTWPPASCTAVSAPLLNGTYVNLTPAVFSIRWVSISSVSFESAPPMFQSPFLALTACRYSFTVLY